MLVAKLSDDSASEVTTRLRGIVAETNDVELGQSLRALLDAIEKTRMKSAA
jgi:hypothetical protein